MKEYTALQINGVEERLSTYGWLIYIFIPLDCRCYRYTRHYHGMAFRKG